MSAIRRRWRFTGTVQGVGFRYYARAAALHLGLTGWVANNWDGSGTLDSTDVFYLMLGIAKSAVGISPDWTAAQEKAADIDGSGRADSTDVFYLMLYIAQNGAGIPTTWEDIVG